MLLPFSSLPVSTHQSTHQLAPRPRKCFLKGFLALLLLGAASTAAAQAPTVDGRFFSTGDDQYYELTMLSIGGSGFYTAIVDDVLYAALVVDHGVNDNAYHDQDSLYMDSAGWSGGRELRRTIDSEFAEFTLQFGETSWNWKHGYAAQEGTPHPQTDLSDTQTPWVSDENHAGGQGDPPPTHVSASSLSWNMNQFRMNLQAFANEYHGGDASAAVQDLNNANLGDFNLWNWNIDGTDPTDSRQFKSPFVASNPDDITAVDGYPTFSEAFQWEWPMVYEWSVDLAALADEFNDGVIPDDIRAFPGSSHHSPAKAEIDDDIFFNFMASCPEGEDTSPVRLTTEIPDVVGDLSINEIEYRYQQVNVDTEFVLAVGDGASTYDTNPVVDPVLVDGLEHFILDWDTSSFDLEQGSFFQIQVIARGTDGEEGETAVSFEQIVGQLDVELDDCQTSSVPVTLAWFEAKRVGSGLKVEWATASETANLGFNIYGETADGQWQQLNAELIESPVIDSMEPQFYAQRFELSGIQRLMLEDMATHGETERHGPYEIGQTYGLPPLTQPINWEAIADENRRHEANRTAGWRLRNYDPVRMLVDADGIYRVGYEDLLDAGLDLNGVPVNHIGVTNKGEPVPIHTEARGRFGRNDFIEFYGEGLSSTYTDDNVYILHVDNHTSDRMAVDHRRPHPAAALTNTYQARVGRAREAMYAPSSPAESPWYDMRLNVRNNPRTWNFDIEVEGLATSEGARLQVDMWGLTWFDDFEFDHHVIVQLNDVEMADKWFAGRDTVNLDIEIPSDVLAEGSNTLTFHLPADTGAPVAITALVGYSIEYPRWLDISETGQRVFTGDGEAFRISGLSGEDAIVYRVSSGDVERLSHLEFDETGNDYSVSFRGNGEPAIYAIAEPGAQLVPRLEPGRAERDITSGSADYLIISHPNFIDGLTPLVHFHQSQGRVVRVVDVFDIYDQFNHGIFDPQPIQDYIRATAHDMGYQHVLLVGGDTYDYRDNFGIGSISFIPSFYASTTGGIINFAPVDALFVDLNDNRVPDLPIGRFPVRTVAELEEIINKTLEYANRDYPHSAVVATDKAEPSLSFSAFSERYLEDFIDWDVARAHLDDLTIGQARDILFDRINQGMSMTTWWGHSAGIVWSFSGLFDNQDVDALSNLGRPTAVLQWGCWNNYHVAPAYQTLGHRFMLTEGKGAALVVGSSTLTNAASGQQLGLRLMPLVADPGMTIGQAMTQAKQDLATTRPHMTDAILGWTILGDPALVIGD